MLTAFPCMYLQILLAIDLAIDCKDTQADLWSRICRDEYMAYAVQECYYSIEKILHSLVEGEGRLWYYFSRLCNVRMLVSCFKIWNAEYHDYESSRGSIFFVAGWRGSIGRSTTV